MKYINKVIGVVVVLVSSMLVLAIFLPVKQTSFATIKLDVPVSDAFSQVKNLKNRKSWNPFMKGDKEKLNHLDIISIVNNKQIDTKIDLGNNRFINGQWIFKREEGLTCMCWKIEVNNLSYPVGRLMGLFFEPMIKPVQKEVLLKIEKRYQNK